MTFEPIEHDPDDYSDVAEVPAPEPVPIRQRPIPDQLDYYSELLAPLVDWSRLRDREAMIAVGATLVGLGAIAAQLRAHPLPSITDGITDFEAEASAEFDLTIDEVRALHPDDAAVAEVRAWLPEGTPDNALIELEAHTLRSVLKVLDQWEWNAREAAAQHNAAESRLETAKINMRMLREQIGEGHDELRKRSVVGPYSTDENDHSYAAGYADALRVAYSASAAMVGNWRKVPDESR